MCYSPFRWNIPLDSVDVLLSYSVISLATRILTIKLINPFKHYFYVQRTEEEKRKEEAENRAIDAKEKKKKKKEAAEVDSGDEDADGSDADMEMDEATKAKLGTGMSKFKT